MMNIKRLLEKIKRKPQVFHYKDIAYLLIKLDVGKIQKVLELGGGNGYLTISLLKYLNNVKKYIVFEKRKEFFDVLKENINKFCEKKEIVELRLEEFSEKTKLDEKFDLIVVDIPYCKGLVERVISLLEEGGLAVFYVLNISQALELLKELPDESFLDEIVEMHLRNWIFKKMGSKVIFRPENFELSHTGLLVFIKNANIRTRNKKEKVFN
jgi:tRNA A58 N-methylase Trm61